MPSKKNPINIQEVFTAIIDDDTNKFAHLIQAIKTSNNPKIYLEAGLTATKKLKDQVAIVGYTPLLVAIDNRRIDMMQQLLEAGADPNHATEKGERLGYLPLADAVAKNNAKIITLLLEKGANPNLISRFQNEDNTFFSAPIYVQAIITSPLHIVLQLLTCIHTHQTITEGLYANSTPLMLAIKRYELKRNQDSIEIIKNMIHHFKINLLETFLDFNYLTGIIYFLPQQAVEEILRNANINIVDSPEPIYWACEAERMDLVNAWLPKIRDIDMALPKNSPKAGENALTAAVKTNNKLLVETLIRRGADVNFTNPYNQTCNILFQAAEESSLEIVTTLIEKGADPDSVSLATYEGALSAAANRNRVDIVEILLKRSRYQKNCDPPIPIKHMRLIALQFAIQNNFLPNYLLLRNTGVDLDTEILNRKYIVSGELKHKEFSTRLLHIAAHRGRVVMLCDLLKQNADPNLTISQGSWQGLSPIACAIFTNSMEAIDRLIEHKADVNQVISSGFFRGLTPLALALLNNSLSLAKLLIKQGAQINSFVLNKNQQKVPLVAWLIENNNLDGFKFLLAQSIQLDMRIAHGVLENKTLLNVIINVWPCRVEFLIAYLEQRKTPGKIVTHIRNGMHPLFAAIKEKNTELIALVLKYGIDVTDHTFKNETPASYAKSCGCSDEILNLLTQPARHKTKPVKTHSRFFEELTPHHETVSVHLEVAKEYVQKPQFSLRLHFARHESDAIRSILVKKITHKDDHYLLMLHLLRKYEALHRYAEETDDESIVKAKTAKNVRNMVAHLFYELDKNKLFALARHDQQSTRQSLLKKLNEPGAHVITQNIEDAQLYKELLPKLDTADGVFDVKDLVKRIIEELNGLFQTTAKLGKTHLMLFSEMADIVKMRLTMIGQYVRLLKIQDNNFAYFSNLLSTLFAPKIEDSFIQATLLFFNNCIALRNKVAHKFSEIDGSISIDFINIMMKWNKNICRNFKPDWAFALETHNTVQADRAQLLS